MRGLTRRWMLHGGDPNPSIAVDLAPLLKRLLAARGLQEPQHIDRFCEPRLNHLHDPGRLPNIHDAAARLAQALRAGERIVIYGDYDVDGITASAILFHVMRTLRPDANLRSYVPHRLDEGYGLNCEALRQLRADGADVVVSVDCGITAVEPARTARELGLDLIITDHHNVPDGAESLPDALLVHPGLPGSDYPFHDLCGAGVAFKLAWQLARQWCGSDRVSNAVQQTLLNMLPLAALGTIADIVPLVDENRIIATNGLRLIKQTPIAGLRALIEASNLMGDDIDSEKVGFILGPRLNACGRMGHAAEAMHLLTDADEAEAVTIARNLTRLNRQRQQTEREIFDVAATMAEDAGMTRDDCRVIVLAHRDWHPGVVGIVCSRLADRFGRPAVLMQDQGDVCKGSARSIDGYSIHAGFKAAAAHIEAFGGHDMAAGLTVRTDRLDAFTEVLAEHVNAHVAVDDLVQSIRIDCDATLDELTLPTVQRIAALSPFGRANPRPTVRVQRVTITEPPRQIGGGGQHLSMRLRQDGTAGRRVLRTVWWKAGHLAGDLAAGMPLDVAVQPKLNTWNGRTSVEAEIRDVMLLET